MPAHCVLPFADVPPLRHARAGGLGGPRRARRPDDLRGQLHLDARTRRHPRRCAAAHIKDGGRSSRPGSARLVHGQGGLPRRPACRRPRRHRRRRPGACGGAGRSPRRRPHRPPLQRLPRPPLARPQRGRLEPRHHLDASHWLADRGSRVHGVEGPVDGQGGNEGVPEPPRLPRPGDDPLRVAREPRAAAREGRVPVHRLSAQAEGRDRARPCVPSPSSASRERTRLRRDGLEGGPLHPRRGTVRGLLRHVAA